MADPFSFIASSVSSRPVHISAAATSKSQSKQSRNNNSFDAFQDLVSFDVNATTNKQTSNLTLAERAAKAEQDRKARLNNDTHVFQDSFWDKFDNSSTSIPPKEARLTSNVLTSSAADRGPRIATPAEDSWDIDFISLESSKIPPTLPSTSSSSNINTNLLDSDDTSPLVDLKGSSHPPTLARSDTPGSFDFADSDERYENDEDDILGDLGKPIALVKSAVSEVIFFHSSIFSLFIIYLFRKVYLLLLLSSLFAHSLHLHRHPRHMYWANWLKWDSPFHKPKKHS